MSGASAQSKRMDQKWISQEEFEAKCMTTQALALSTAYSPEGVKASIMTELTRKYGPRLAKRVANSAKRRKVSLQVLLRSMADKALK